MKKRIALVLCCALFLFCFSACPAWSQTKQADIFPGTTWTKATPNQLGWDEPKLDDALKFFQTLPPASLFVVDHGKVVVEWGDSALKIKISSMRKSILSALYGIYADRTHFDLDKSIGALGIDDAPPLTPQEKKATVRMLLAARSGIYHSYVAGTPAMREKMPTRGSHEPGSFWFYNNWDFNALGTIFEQEFHETIDKAFREQISVPTHMQDFQVQDMYYLRSRPDSPEYEKSRHAAYHFRMTARDLARFGYLMLRGGDWNGDQIIPSEWVQESTRSHSETDGGGYGYLWWVNGFGLAVNTFSAEGALAKYVVVIPSCDLVLVYLNHTEFPDNASAMKPEELKSLPTISKSQMSHLLGLLLEAHREALLSSH